MCVFVCVRERESAPAAFIKAEVGSEYPIFVGTYAHVCFSSFNVQYVHVCVYE